MSDWSLSELEHFNWDEFGKSEDHMVPHPVGDLVADRLVHCDPHKKLIHAVENNVGKTKHSTGFAINTILSGKEDPSFSAMNNGNSSITNGSHSGPANIFVPALGHTEKKDISAIASEAKISGYFVTDHENDIKSNKFNSKDPVFGASLSTNDRKSLHSSLNGLSLEVTKFPLDNEQKDRQSDLVYCDWPGIDNFEDIDKMFRNWDSTFGQEHAGTADGLSWFSSSSNTIYASEIASEPGLKPSTSDLGAVYGKREQQFLNTNFLHQDILSSAEHSISDNELCADLLDIDTEDKSNFAAEEKVKGGGHKRRTLGHAHTCKRNDFNGCGTSNMMESQPSSQEKGIKRSADKMLLAADVTAPQMYTSKQFSQQKHSVDSSPSRFMQNFDLHGKMEYALPTRQLPITQATSCTEFEDDTMPCSSLNDSDDLVSCQTQEKKPNQFYRPQTMRQQENLEQVHQGQQSSIKMIVEPAHQQSAFRSKTKAWKKQIETRGGIEQEDIGFELPMVGTNSAVAQESSCITTVVSDDISCKASSFLQLQDVMHQLDVRTKQCIRESLYRLARNAHQRHSFSNTNSIIEANIDLFGIHGTEASKSLDPMDGETNTNPIDRSIAHLLFHKPSKPAARSVDDATSLGSHVTHEQLHIPIRNHVMVHSQGDQRIFSGRYDAF